MLSYTVDAILHDADSAVRCVSEMQPHNQCVPSTEQMLAYTLPFGWSVSAVITARAPEDVPTLLTI